MPTLYIYLLVFLLYFVILSVSWLNRWYFNQKQLCLWLSHIRANRSEAKVLVAGTIPTAYILKCRTHTNKTDLAIVRKCAIGVVMTTAFCVTCSRQLGVAVIHPRPRGCHKKKLVMWHTLFYEANLGDKPHDSSSCRASIGKGTAGFRSETCWSATWVATKWRTLLWTDSKHLKEVIHRWNMR